MNTYPVYADLRRAPRAVAILQTVADNPGSTVTQIVALQGSRNARTKQGFGVTLMRLRRNGLIDDRSFLGNKRALCLTAAGVDALAQAS